MRRAILAFFPAVLGAYILGSLLASQVIIRRLELMGMPVTLRDHLRMSWQDLFGLLDTYLPALLVAFLLALPPAAGLSRLLPKLRVVFFCLAGAAGVICAHVVAKEVLGVSALAATRDTDGLLLQGAAGWFGGYLFYVFMGWAHR